MSEKAFMTLEERHAQVESYLGKTVTIGIDRPIGYVHHKGDKTLVYPINYGYIPGVLGGEQSAEIESFSDGDNIEYPQYTRPEDFRGMKVPDVLLSGNHGEIAKWRAAHSGQATGKP
jgi:tRNA (guanine-N1)-methyltransferase